MRCFVMERLGNVLWVLQCNGDMGLSQCVFCQGNLVGYYSGDGATEKLHGG